jgi:hypothetical protein
MNRDTFHSISLSRMKPGEIHEPKHSKTKNQPENASSGKI